MIMIHNHHNTYTVYTSAKCPLLPFWHSYWSARFGVYMWRGWDGYSLYLLMCPSWVLKSWANPRKCHPDLDKPPVASRWGICHQVREIAFNLLPLQPPILHARHLWTRSSVKHSKACFTGAILKRLNTNFSFTFKSQHFFSFSFEKKS